MVRLGLGLRVSGCLLVVGLDGVLSVSLFDLRLLCEFGCLRVFGLAGLGCVVIAVGLGDDFGFWILGLQFGFLSDLGLRCLAVLVFVVVFIVCLLSLCAAFWVGRCWNFGVFLRFCGLLF